MNKKLGQIVSFNASWKSGLAELVLENPEGQRELVLCENGATIRAFACCYADEQIILPNHCVNVEALRGKQIEYQTDVFNVLEWFAPAETEIE